MQANFPLCLFGIIKRSRCYLRKQTLRRLNNFLMLTINTYCLRRVSSTSRIVNTNGIVSSRRNNFLSIDNVDVHLTRRQYQVPYLSRLTVRLILLIIVKISNGIYFCWRPIHVFGFSFNCCFFVRNWMFLQSLILSIKVREMEGTIENGKSRDTVNIGHKTQNKEKKMQRRKLKR